MSNLIGVSAFLLAGAAIFAVAYMIRGQLLLSWRLRRSEQQWAAAPATDAADLDTGGAMEQVADPVSDSVEMDVEEDDQNSMPLSWPVRVVATLAAVLLLLLLNSTRAYAGLSPLPDEYFWQAYAASCLMIAWYLAHVWCYAVRIRGTSLSVPGWGFASRKFDLNALQHVEDDGRHTVRLYFKDGARARLTKHVDGYARLRDKLRGETRMAVA